MPVPAGVLKGACLYKLKTVSLYRVAWTKSSCIKNRSGNTVLLQPEIGFKNFILFSFNTIAIFVLKLDRMKFFNSIKSNISNMHLFGSICSAYIQNPKE